MTIALLIVGTGVTAVFADPGEDPSASNTVVDSIISPSSLDLIDNGFGVTFTGKGGYSADGMGAIDETGTVSASIPAGSTIVQAILYGTTFGSSVESIVIEFDGTDYTLDRMTQSEYDGCCNLRSFKHVNDTLTDQVAAKFASDGPGVIDFPVVEAQGNIDGTGLVVIFSNPALEDVSVAVLDGGLSVLAANTTVFFAEPLDTTGLAATLALGIGFGFQGSFADPHVCSGGQRSSVDVNSMRMTTCAGGSDDRESDEGAGNSNLFTVGGFDDSDANPVNPFATSGFDDELYDLTPFVSDGDEEMVITTENFSSDDIIFLAIIQINRAVTVDEKCGDGIDNDGDGMIDEGCLEICDDGVDNDGDGLIDLADPDCKISTPQPPVEPVVGGSFLPIDSTALLLAGIQSSAIWMLPVLAGAAGAGAYYIKTRMNKE